MGKAKVKIYMFGRFEILINGRVALPQLKRSKKTMLFLQYLILKKSSSTTNKELLEALWPDTDSADPSTALRTMLHRYRSMIEKNNVPALKDSVITIRDAYQWNPALDCETDVFEMERIYYETTNKKLSKEERIARYFDIMDLYIGPLLPGSSDEIWVIKKSMYYHDLYLECVFNLIDLLKEEEDYNTVVQVCRKAMDVDVFDERLQMELMMALMKTGKSKTALSQYYYATDMQYKQLGLHPSEELRAIYKMLIEADKQMENDIDTIQKSIDEDDEDEKRGAFVCEYEIFKDIYKLERRILERHNTPLYIVLMTMSNIYDKALDPIMLDSIMRGLLDVTVRSLRRGDTISRYSATQYVLLLASIDNETGVRVMERIKKQFYNEYVRSSMVLSYKVRPLNVGMRLENK